MSVLNDDDAQSPPAAKSSVRDSLADRRLLFASGGGAPQPLTSMMHDGGGSDAVRDRVELSTTVLHTESLVASTVVPPGSGWASPCARINGSLRSRIGSRIGGSVVSLDVLRSKYAQMLEALASANAAASSNGSMPSTRPVSLTDSISAMPPHALAQHCVELHTIVLEALGGLVPPTTPSSECFDVLSPAASAPFMAASSSPNHALKAEPTAGSWTDDSSTTPHLTASAQRLDHLQQSISAMSMVAEPVRTTNEARKSVDDDGSKMINDYVVLDDIGRGSFGKVKLAFDTRLCRMVAIKVVRKPADWDSTVLQQSPLNADRRQSLLASGSRKMELFHALQREIAVMKKLRHKSIVSLYEVIDDPEAEKLYLVMQYINNGAVGNVRSDCTCTTVPSNDLMRIALQLFAGLQYLHTRGIVHRDIKPENILVNTDGDAFLADFGVSEAFDRVGPATGVATGGGRCGEEAALAVVDSVCIEGRRGTTLFMAPELLDGVGVARGMSIDVWAMGVTLYALLVGRLPFSSLERIVDPNAPDWAPVPQLWRSLLEGLLHRDATMRLTAATARQLIKSIVTQQAPAKHGKEDEGVLSDDATSPPSDLTRGGTAAAIPLHQVQRSRLDVASLDVTNAFTPMARRRHHPTSIRVSETAQQQASFQWKSPASRKGSGGCGGHLLAVVPHAPAPLSCQHLHATAVDGGSAGGHRAPPSVATLHADDVVRDDPRHCPRASSSSVLPHWKGNPAASPVDVALFPTVADHGPAVRVTVTKSADVHTATAGAAHKEMSKCHRRLQQLLDEQHTLETKRRLIPHGVLPPPADMHAQ